MPMTQRQRIVGAGTQADPYVYEMGARTRPPIECADQQHNAEHGKWFIPAFPTTARCPWCSTERPAKSTLLHGKAHQHPKPPPAKKAVQVDKAEWETFQFFRGWILKVKADAQRLTDERTMHDFGVYGKIRCTEREHRLAELEVASLKSNPLPVDYLSIATGLSVSEIEALRSGAGANPDYPQIQAACQIKETRGELLTIIKEWQEVLADPEMPLADKSKAYKEIVAKHSQLLDLLPKPKKKEPLDFGPRDQTPAEELATQAIAQMLLTEPPTDSRPGGPGPLR